MEIAQTQWGYVNTLEVKIEQLIPPSMPAGEIEVQIETMAWFPGPTVSQDLPINFELRFRCVRGGDGIRHILPQGPLQGFLLQAALAGHAVLQAKQAVSHEQNFAYHAMRIIFQKASHVQEKLTRTFHRAQDLHLSVAERFEHDVKDILPETIGQDSKGQGERWSVAKLMDTGRQVAIDAGHTDPTEEGCIRRGLWEAARLAPIDFGSMKEDELIALVRLAVFDLGPEEVANSKEGKKEKEQLTERVVERLLKAIAKHGDEDTEEFHEWFFEKADNLIHQIAKQTKNGGPVERTTVRQVLLETVFRSFRYIGDCLHLAMRELTRCLPESLNPEERSLFDAIYCRHPALGGLPFALLSEQFMILKEVVPEIWSAPNDKERWATLLRYLQFHAEMIRNKRRSERHYKQTNHNLNRQGNIAQTIPLPSRVSQPSNDSANHTRLLQTIAAELREREQSICQCGSTEGWFAELDVAKSTPAILIFDDRCIRCGHSENRQLASEDARTLAKTLLDGV